MSGKILNEENDIRDYAGRIKNVSKKLTYLCLLISPETKPLLVINRSQYILQESYFQQIKLTRTVEKILITT
jgi:hypothetical protein